MKRIVVILVISFVAFGCKAQTVVSRTKASGKNIVYANSGKVEKTGRIIVSNEKNKLQDVKPHFPLSAGVIPDLNIAKLDESQLTRILLEALSINKLKQMQDQKDLYIFLYLSDKGEILELWFFADQKTKINAHELEYIETNIKNRIHATFAKDDLKGSNFIPLLRSFNFAKLLQLKQSD